MVSVFPSDLSTSIKNLLNLDIRRHACWLTIHLDHYNIFGPSIGIIALYRSALRKFFFSFNLDATIVHSLSNGLAMCCLVLALTYSKFLNKVQLLECSD